MCLTESRDIPYNPAIGENEPTGYQRPHYQSSIVKNISLNDPIDTSNHTAEFHHRSILWSMANSEWFLGGGALLGTG
jgi:hypothetical protein